MGYGGINKQQVTSDKGQVNLNKFALLKIYISSEPFWTTLKLEWLTEVGRPSLDPINTDSKDVDLICKNGPNPFRKIQIKDWELSLTIMLKCTLRSLFL